MEKLLAEHKKILKKVVKKYPKYDNETLETFKEDFDALNIYISVLSKEIIEFGFDDSEKNSYGLKLEELINALVTMKSQSLGKDHFL